MPAKKTKKTIGFIVEPKLIQIKIPEYETRKGFEVAEYIEGYPRKGDNYWDADVKKWVKAKNKLVSTKLIAIVRESIPEVVFGKLVVTPNLDYAEMSVPYYKIPGQDKPIRYDKLHSIPNWGFNGFCFDGESQLHITPFLFVVKEGLSCQIALPCIQMTYIPKYLERIKNAN